MEDPSKRIHRKLVNITSKKRKSTGTRVSQKMHNSLVVNYQIMPLLDLGTQQIDGLVLIIEDVTDMIVMKRKVQMMESQIQAVNTAPQVTSNTPLQQCIEMIYDVAANSETHKNDLYDIVAILKKGNLEKPQVELDR